MVQLVNFRILFVYFRADSVSHRQCLLGKRKDETSSSSEDRQPKRASYQREEKSEKGEREIFHLSFFRYFDESSDEDELAAITVAGGSSVAIEAARDQIASYSSAREQREDPSQGERDGEEEEDDPLDAFMAGIEVGRGVYELPW